MGPEGTTLVGVVVVLVVVVVVTSSNFLSAVAGEKLYLGEVVVAIGCLFVTGGGSEVKSFGGRVPVEGVVRVGNFSTRGGDAAGVVNAGGFSTGGVRVPVDAMESTLSGSGLACNLSFE